MPPPLPPVSVAVTLQPSGGAIHDDPAVDVAARGKDWPAPRGSTGVTGVRLLVGETDGDTEVDGLTDGDTEGDGANDGDGALEPLELPD